MKMKAAAVLNLLKSLKLQIPHTTRKLRSRLKSLIMVKNQKGIKIFSLKTRRNRKKIQATHTTERVLLKQTLR